MKGTVIKISAAAVILILIVLVWIYPEPFAHPVTKNAVINVGTSEKFSDLEIEAAANAVIDGFSFSNCELLTVSYDEKFSDEYLEYERAPYDKQDMIVLCSSFKTGSFAYGSGFPPNSYCDTWNWTLVRDGDDWTILHSGQC